MVQVVIFRCLTSQSRAKFQGNPCGVSVGKVALERVRIPVLGFAFANYRYRHVPCALLSSMVRTMRSIGAAVTQRPFHPTTREYRK
jgi:hypothetical protein